MFSVFKCVLFLITESYCIEVSSVCNVNGQRFIPTRITQKTQQNKIAATNLPTTVTVMKLLRQIGPQMVHLCLEIQLIYNYCTTNTTFCLLSMFINSRTLQSPQKEILLICIVKIAGHCERSPVFFVCWHSYYYYHEYCSIILLNIDLYKRN